MEGRVGILAPFFDGGSSMSLDPQMIRTFGREYAELFVKRQALLKEIRFAEQHFLASLSEPLSTHLHDLLRQDAVLLSELIRLSPEK